MSALILSHEVSLLGGTGFQTITAVTANPLQLTYLPQTDSVGSTYSWSPIFLSYGSSTTATLSASTSYIDGSPTLVPIPQTQTITKFTLPGYSDTITAIVSTSAGTTFLVPAAALQTVGPAATAAADTGTGGGAIQQGGAPADPAAIPTFDQGAGGEAGQPVPAATTPIAAPGQGDGTTGSGAAFTTFAPISTRPPFALSSSAAGGIYTIPGAFSTFPDGDVTVVYPRPSPTTVVTVGTSRIPVTGSVITQPNGDISTSFSLPTIPPSSQSSTASATSSQATAAGVSSGSGLSAAQIGGIALGSSAVVLLLLALLFVFMRSRRKSRWLEDPSWAMVSGDDPEMAEIAYVSPSSGLGPSRPALPPGAAIVSRSSRWTDSSRDTSGSDPINEEALFFSSSTSRVDPSEERLAHVAPDATEASDPTTRPSEDTTRDITSSSFGTSVASNKRLSEFGTIQVQPRSSSDRRESSGGSMLGLNLSALFANSLWRSSRDSRTSSALFRRASSVDGYASLALPQDPIKGVHSAASLFSDAEAGPARLDVPTEEDEDIGSEENRSLLLAPAKTSTSDRTFGGGKYGSDTHSVHAKAASSGNSRRDNNSSSGSSGSRQARMDRFPLPSSAEVHEAPRI
jgi:hypothetical protein